MDGHRTPLVKTAWIFIILLVLGIGFLQTIPEEDDQGQQIDETGLVMTQLEGEYLLGVSSLFEMPDEITDAAIMLDTGTVAQRQRYMAFMIAMGNLEKAQHSASTMREDLVAVDREIPDQYQETQRMLDVLLRGETLQTDHPPFATTLGWFGELLDADDSQRTRMESAARVKVLVLFGVVSCVALAGCCGFIALVFIFIRITGGRIRSGMIPRLPHHGIYAEVFSIWLILFLGMAMIAGLVSSLIDADSALLGMVFTLIAFFGSLTALLWALIRGVSWKQLREDIGWHTGKGLFKEIGCGLAGYAMTIPILGVGILFTLFLMFLQTLLAGGDEADLFAGTGGGAHPIVVEIAHGRIALHVLLLLLASVAAPIIEETMFRGVLYRHLRSSSQALRGVLSITISTLIVSFIFASIHPQGWVAIPALMSIAIGMNLVREWRGSLIPSMVIHGTSNGIVTGTMIMFLS